MALIPQSGPLIKRVYLAGAIYGQADPGGWRDTVSHSLPAPWKAVNPLDLEVDIEKPSEVVDTDLAAILGCKAVIAKVDEPSWGTGMELFFAKRLGLPVIGWTVGKHNGASPWLIHHTSCLVPTLPAAISFLTRV
jgi:nucleoside 2-deoxyribosyltransferase